MAMLNNQRVHPNNFWKWQKAITWNFRKLFGDLLIPKQKSETHNLEKNSWAFAFQISAVHFKKGAYGLSSAEEILTS